MDGHARAGPPGTDPPEEATRPACPVCGAGRWSPRRTWTGLRACGGCGTLLNDRSRSRLEEEARYLAASAPAEGGDSDIAIRRFEWAASEATRDRATRPSSVLDVGCGEGAFLAAAREAGWRASGIEINPRAAETGRRRGLDVACGSLFDVGLPFGPWDLITFWDVLDQLEDPLQALRLAVRQLVPAGLLIVRGRNARMHAPVKRAVLYLRRMAPAIPLPDPAVVHRWGFAPGGFRALLPAAGLSEVRLHADLAGGGPLRGAADFLWRVSRGRAYAFASVLVSARKPADGGARGDRGQALP